MSIKIHKSKHVRLGPSGTRDEFFFNAYYTHMLALKADKTLPVLIVQLNAPILEVGS